MSINVYRLKFSKKETSMKDFKFEVGKSYQNMKGPYEVLSIKGDGMRIRWDTGEEATTTKSFQRRVIERMQYERELKEKAQLESKNAAKRKTTSNAKDFEGLEEMDFSGKVSGTTWRRRRYGLGGAVSVSSKSDAQAIKSWAVSRKPMIHWANVEHYNVKNRSSQAKFFATIDKIALTFGFGIERSGGAEDAENDWNAFVTWLKDIENDAWLKEIAAEQKLSVFIYGNKTTVSDTIIAQEGRWSLCRKKGREELESLWSFLESLPGGIRMNLQIAQRVEKEGAIARKGKIARDIEQLFEMLMPLYEASAVF
jgi:hypothetical protein